MRTREKVAVVCISAVLLFIVIKAVSLHYEALPHEPQQQDEAAVPPPTQEQKDLVAHEAKWGPRPEQSVFDGSVPEVTAYLQSILRDPDSLKFSGWGELFYVDELGWSVWADYRARNGFGGYERRKDYFFIKNGTVYMTDSVEKILKTLSALVPETQAENHISSSPKSPDK